MAKDFLKLLNRIYIRIYHLAWCLSTWLAHKKKLSIDFRNLKSQILNGPYLNSLIDIKPEHSKSEQSKYEQSRSEQSKIETTKSE